MPNFREMRLKSSVLILTAVALIGCTSTDSAEKSATSSGPSTVSNKQCGDVLSQFATKPEQLEFLECNVVAAPQVALSARYRIAGNSAESIEDFLMKEYGMSELHFACCGWEPKEGGRGTIQVSGRYFSITMHSDETLISERSKWNEIPYFYLVVEELINI